MRLTLLLILVTLSAPAMSAEPAANAAKSKSPAAVPSPPAPPENYNPPAMPDLPSGEPEPEITITTKGTEIHEEYRLNGRLYMIKVIPKKGKPYYLIDQEGSGQFRRSDFDSRIAIPSWVIKRF